MSSACHPPSAAGMNPAHSSATMNKYNSKPIRKRTTVLFGTSITTKLPRDGLAGRGRHFVNVSQSGARIQDIERLVDNFYHTHRSATDIEEVILSFNKGSTETDCDLNSILDLLTGSDS